MTRAPFTRAVWDAEWLKAFNAYRNAGLVSIDRCRERAWKETEARFGPRPAGGLPLKYKVAATLLKHKLEGWLKGVNPMQDIWKRLGYAAVYGVISVIGALQISGLPHDEQGWIGIIGVFGATFWAKFSHPESAVDPNRAIWTPEERAVNTLPKE